MISYRQADLLRTLKSSNARCAINAHVGISNDVLPFRVSVNMTEFECDIPEAAGDIKDFIREILIGLGFVFIEKMNTFISDELQSMSEAEKKYFEIFTSIKNSGRAKETSNKVSWIPGTRIKDIELWFVMR